MTTATKKPAKTRKPATAISNRLPAVDVEYDGAKGKRLTKHFDDANAAKRFYATKDKAGKNPKVIGDAPASAPAAADKPAKRKTAKADKPAGVAYGLTATYAAGLVIKSRGLAHGVTEDMVSEVAKLTGRENSHQDWFNLRNAWHAIRAYTGEPADGPAIAAN
jgi:hypothetical protein